MGDPKDKEVDNGCCGANIILEALKEGVVEEDFRTRGALSHDVAPKEATI